MALRGRSKQKGSREPLRSRQAAERQTRERLRPRKRRGKELRQGSHVVASVNKRTPRWRLGHHRQRPANWNLQEQGPTGREPHGPAGRDPQVQTNTENPEFTTDEDLTLVEYRDTGACSTLTSRYLEVVVLSRTPRMVLGGRPFLIVQSQVGLSRTTVEGGRGPSLSQACTTKASEGQTPDAFVPPLVTRGEISFWRSNSVSTRRLQPPGRWTLPIPSRPTIPQQRLQRYESPDP